MEFESVIGLEVHAQLKTHTKIFCGCATAFGAPPNTHVCPVCLGLPGVLPVLNRNVVAFSIRMALACECQINHESRFARKNYFYPDLPKGYQISQYERPIAEHGRLAIETPEEGGATIGITRIHMEEDAGKLIHDPERPLSRVDLNRTGVPLIEIVSEPDLRSPEQAGAYLRKLRSVVRYLEICDGNLEEGSFRCDANVSLRPRGSTTLGTRTEIKNLNSFRNVERALHYEIERQRECLLEGDAVVQETRLWDPDKNRTFSMRGKEEAHDYRYFPDPDLLPVVIDETWIETIRAQLPELPDARKARYMDRLGLTSEDAGRLAAARETGDYFECCLAVFPQAKPVANWVLGELAALLRAAGRPIEESPVAPEALARLLQLVDEGTISGKIAKRVFETMAQTGEAADKIVAAQGLVQMSDSDELARIVDEVLAAAPEEVAAYRNGRTKLMGFFVGQVMKATRGQANPQKVNAILKGKLAE
ncbi:MAG: Asp-tRNA(Asn)/Glu-tRNA(Gln) amidotransferase subunit GatB [Desulfobacterales bacterium]|nr:Asp-tRNA(Asn)/Glu-tRNA(Gln) amidotransferase subunit GatB [Desulfobacterales bacterium]